MTLVPMKDRISRTEIRKDALQDTVEATATAVGAVTTIVTTAAPSAAILRAMRPAGATDVPAQPADFPWAGAAGSGAGCAPG